jgi:hypothetical protein
MIRIMISNQFHLNPKMVFSKITLTIDNNNANLFHRIEMKTYKIRGGE